MMEQRRKRCEHLLHILGEELRADEKRQLEWSALVSKVVGRPSSSSPMSSECLHWCREMMMNQERLIVPILSLLHPFRLRFLSFLQSGPQQTRCWIKNIKARGEASDKIMRVLQVLPWKISVCSALLIFSDRHLPHTTIYSLCDPHPIHEIGVSLPLWQRASQLFLAYSSIYSFGRLTSETTEHPQQQSQCL